MIKYRVNEVARDLNLQNKDVLDIFNPDQKSNHVAALIVAILDSLVTFGFARAFYLYTVMNKEPLEVSSDGYDRVYSN